MVFHPYVILVVTGQPVEVLVTAAEPNDLAATKESPQWQTDWTSGFLADQNLEIAAIKAARLHTGMASLSVSKKVLRKPWTK